MDHGPDALVRIMHGLEAALHERSQRLAIVGGRQLAERPDHAVRDLVADLHHLRQRSGLLEVAEHFLRIGIDFFLHFHGIVLRPCFRRPLLARIRPEIAVMEIDEYLHAKRMCALRHRQSALRRRIAAAVFMGWIIPDAQTNPVDAVLLHDGQLVHLRPVHIIELAAQRLQLRQHRNIRALDKVSGKVPDRVHLHRRIRCAAESKRPRRDRRKNQSF